MRWNETRDRLSRIMMPGVDSKVIYRVNRAMDNRILGRFTSIAI